MIYKDNPLNMYWLVYPNEQINKELKVKLEYIWTIMKLIVVNDNLVDNVIN